MIVCDFCKNTKQLAAEGFITLRKKATSGKWEKRNQFKKVIDVKIALCDKCTPLFCSKLHHFVFDVRKEGEQATEEKSPELTPRTQEE